MIGMNTPSQPVTEERISALPPSQQAEWRDYLKVSERRKAEDKAFLAKEMAVAHLAHPLTPGLSHNAHSVPGADQAEAWYHSAEARQKADIVVSFQTPSGGWSKNLDLSDHLRRPGEIWASENNSSFLTAQDFDRPQEPSWHYIATIDNDATTTEIAFLARVADHLPGKEGEPYRQSFERGLRYLFESQFPNGGWPQVWPLEGGYHDAVTYNDDAMLQVILLLKSVAEGKYSFVSSEIRAKAAASVKKGIDCILASQVVEGGKKKAWAQQHDALTLKPSSARNFEPPAETAAESARLLQFLMTLPVTPELQESIQGGIAWLQKTTIHGEVWQNRNGVRDLYPAAQAAPLWARYYELGSDRPIFGDRDRTIHDTVKDISPERRNGYAWFSTQPEEALELYSKWIRSAAARAHPAQ